MPPRRPTNPTPVVDNLPHFEFREIEVPLPQPIQPKPVKYMVSDFLKNNYFDMAQKLDIKLECPICLEDICCKRCFSLLPCGHHLHLNCLIRLDKCPLCRE